MMKFSMDNDNPEVQQGKQIVERFLSGKGAADFEWSGDFDTRNWRVTFDWSGVRYITPINQISLTNLRNDPLKATKLEALWKNKTQI